MVEIDGSSGEGGGQVVRTALTLAAITGHPVRLLQIRAKRRNPGLAPQHLTAVNALAQICGAEVHGAALRSTVLEFRPSHAPRAGSYELNVASAAQGGSAGAVTLILQSLLLPLALAAGISHVTLTGGTHVRWSPPWHYLAYVYLPAVARMGLVGETRLDAWGFYPVGQGRVAARISGSNMPLQPITLVERGPVRRIWGLAVAANLPAHIPQRIASRATSLLSAAGLRSQVRPLRERAAGPGAGLFLVAEYAEALSGFSALGEKGKPSEQVAEEASHDLLAHHASGHPVDMHLADQLLLPAALAAGRTIYDTCRVTPHLLTNAHIIRQLLEVEIVVQGEVDSPGHVEVSGAGLTGGPA
jgi:RNA 3'-terminal phosphate cyclase (ATP)